MTFRRPREMFSQTPFCEVGPCKASFKLARPRRSLFLILIFSSLPTVSVRRFDPMLFQDSLFTSTERNALQPFKHWEHFFRDTHALAERASILAHSLIRPPTPILGSRLFDKEPWEETP